MKLKIVFPALLILTLLGCNLRTPKNAGSLDIYLLIGQSNMAGRAEITMPFRDTLQGVYLLTNDSLIYMINAFRKDFKLPDLPFVACELSEAKSHRIPFNLMLNKLPERLQHTAVISSAGTSTLDSTHFDTESQRILGERYAEQILLLQVKGK